MKYRLLSDEELKLLEEELKQFLIVNGIDGATWQKINEDSLEKAVQLVELFSDSVLEKVYGKVRFLEFRSAETCMVFHFLPDNIELIGLSRKNEELDLSTPEKIHDALSDHSEKLSIFKTSKSYHDTRETEIHRMIEQGCYHSTESFWEALNNLINN